MIKFSHTMAAILVSFCFTTEGHTETLQSMEDTYIVKYSDGTVERYLVKYSAQYDSSWSEDGHPSDLSKGWIEDTRKCRWDATSRIERQACLVSRSGQTFCHANLHRIYSQNTTGKGSDFQLTTLHPENCKAAEARRTSDFANVKNNVISVMPEVTNQDRASVVEDFKKMAEVVEVSAE